MTCWYAFSRVFRRLNFVSSYDWFIALFARAVIGQSSHFGYNTQFKAILLIFYSVFSTGKEPDWAAVPQRLLETITEEDQPDNSASTKGNALESSSGRHLNWYAVLRFFSRSEE